MTLFFSQRPTRYACLASLRRTVLLFCQENHCRYGLLLPEVGNTVRALLIDSALKDVRNEKRENTRILVIDVNRGSMDVACQSVSKSPRISRWNQIEVPASTKLAISTLWCRFPSGSSGTVLASFRSSSPGCRSSSRRYLPRLVLLQGGHKQYLCGIILFLVHPVAPFPPLFRAPGLVISTDLCFRCSDFQW